jgi:NAD(P)-dependent dehydrogenase (short-subunit alcohol dehydrogenase family)
MGNRLEGKVAVITGGASGIGEGTVRRFVQEGARVLIGDLNEDGAQALAKELGDAAAARAVDVRREDQVAALMQDAVDRWGQLDCVFNNAGFGGALGPIDETSEADFDLTMDVLFKGVFFGVKHAAPILKKQGSGSIINTGSVAGIEGGIGPHIYGAAKAAVIFLSKSVALELAEHQVRVNAICPGFITTALATGKGQDNTDEHLDRFRSRYANAQPIGRTGEPADIANTALWLASDESTFVTGQALVVDGGLITGKAWREQGRQFTRPHPITVYNPDA